MPCPKQTSSNLTGCAPNLSPYGRLKDKPISAAHWYPWLIPHRSTYGTFECTIGYLSSSPWLPSFLLVVFDVGNIRCCCVNWLPSGARADSLLGKEGSTRYTATILLLIYTKNKVTMLPNLIGHIFFEKIPEFSNRNLFFGVLRGLRTSSTLK